MGRETSGSEYRSGVARAGPGQRAVRGRGGYDVAIVSRAYARVCADARARSVVFAHGCRSIYRGSEVRGVQKTLGASGEKSAAADRGAYFSENRKCGEGAPADRGSSATGVPPARERRNAEICDREISQIPRNASRGAARDPGPLSHGGCGAEGGGSGQRRNAVRGGVADGGRARPDAAANQRGA